MITNKTAIWIQGRNPLSSSGFLFVWTFELRPKFGAREIAFIYNIILSF